MNKETRNSVFQKLEKMKGEIYHGNALERIVNSIYEIHNPNKKWRLSENIDDCSYEDDNHDRVNEFYVHIEIDEDCYADLLCIINNSDEPQSDWIILVKDILVN